jgi:hypothetical protein
METLSIIFIVVSVILLIFLIVFMTSNAARESFGVKCPTCPKPKVCPEPKECPGGDSLTIGVKYKELDNKFLNSSLKTLTKYIDAGVAEACKTYKTEKFPAGGKCSDLDVYIAQMEGTLDGAGKPPEEGLQIRTGVPKPAIDLLKELAPEMKKVFCKADGTIDNEAVDKTVDDVIKMFCNK